MPIKHKFSYIIQQSGGYFYRTYPVSIFGEEQKKSFHGIFKTKKIHKDDYYIIIIVGGEMEIKDMVLGTSDKKLLISEIELLVSKEIYQYPFIPDMKYIITTTGISMI